MYISFVGGNKLEKREGTSLRAPRTWQADFLNALLQGIFSWN